MQFPLEGHADNVIISNNVVNTLTGSLSDIATNVKAWNNIGWVTENGGAAAAVADGGTIAHGLTGTPTYAVATASVSGEFVSITGIGAANLTVAIKKHDNSAGTAQTIYWRAIK